MTRGALCAALWFAVVAAIASGCGGRSVVIGGDPFGEAGQPASGGALPGGGFSGSFSSGGSGFGGGSLLPVGGTEAGGGSANGGTGGLFDPYPLVTYEEGQGYRHSCPHYDEIWGFTCWNFADGPRSCKPGGDPYCNACSCAVPCEDGTDACPSGVTGHPAICVSSATTTRSCFLACSDGNCPAGMTCSRYPGANRNVCVWVSEPGPPS